MNAYLNEDAHYFKGLDLQNATPIKHPLIEKMQATAKMVRAQKLKPRQINAIIWALSTTA